jgi:hypothetical protein
MECGTLFKRTTEFDGAYCLRCDQIVADVLEDLADTFRCATAVHR